MRYVIAALLATSLAGFASGQDYHVTNNCPAYVVTSKTGAAYTIVSNTPDCGCKSQGGPLPETCPCGKPGKCPCSDPWRGLTSDELHKLDPWYDWADSQSKKSDESWFAKPFKNKHHTPAGYPPAAPGFRWEKYPSGQWGLVQDGVEVPKVMAAQAQPSCANGQCPLQSRPIFYPAGRSCPNGTCPLTRP